QPPDEILVEVNAEARPVRQCHEAVDDLRLGRYQLTPQDAVEHLRRDILEYRRRPAGCLEVPARRRGNAGLPAMRHALRAEQLAQVGNAPDLCQTTAASDVGLDDSDLAAGQPLMDFPARRGRLGS